MGLANAQTSTGANSQQSPKANQWEPAQQPANTCSPLEQNTLTDPYAKQQNRWIGKTARFDMNGKRLVGIVMSYAFIGLTPTGNIPDYKVTIRGQSGAILTVSMHETYMDIE